MAKEKKSSFEKDLARLEAIVKELEDESILLEESIDLYEEGMRLSKHCLEKLEQAEQKIEQVQKQHANNEGS